MRLHALLGLPISMLFIGTFFMNETCRCICGCHCFVTIAASCTLSSSSFSLVYSNVHLLTLKDTGESYLVRLAHLYQVKGDSHLHTTYS